MKKQLRRNKQQGMLGGVSAGLAEYFGIDVTLIRIVFLIGVFAPFPVVIPYLILWALMPQVEPTLPTTTDYRVVE